MASSICVAPLAEGFRIKSRLRLLALAWGIAASLVLAVANAQTVKMTLTPTNPVPGDNVFVRVIDLPPGCPGDPRAGNIAPFRFRITVTIDAATLPGTPLVCDFSVDLGTLAQGRYTIDYNNLLSRRSDTFTFDVFPGGGGLMPNPIPAMSWWSFVGLILLLTGAAAFQWRARRRTQSASVFQIALGVLIVSCFPNGSNAASIELVANDDAVDRQLLVVLDPRQQTTTALEVVSRLQSGNESDSYVDLLGKPRGSSTIVGANAFATERAGRLRDVAPLSPEYLLSQSLVLTYDKGRDLEAVLKRISADKRVLSVARNFRFFSSQAVIPNDPYALPTPRPSSPGLYQWGLESINAVNAWQLSKGRAHVAVLDRGIQTDHTDLQASFRPHLSRAFSFDNATNSVIEFPGVGEQAIGQNRGHGTHVAGIISAEANNSQGTAGICRECSAQIYRMDTYDAPTFVAALYRAVASGAQVVNMSFGVLPANQGVPFCGPSPVSCDPNNPNSTPYQPFCTAMQYAYARGVTLVAASGNCAQSSVDFPANYYPYVIAVGGTQRDQNQIGTHFWIQGHDPVPGSNRGLNQWFVAPARDIVSTFYHSAAPDRWNYSCGNQLESNFNAPPNDVVSPSAALNSGWGDCTGTSMAAPHVAATAALVLSANPVAGPGAVREAMRSTTDRVQLGQPYDVNDAWGVPDARKAVEWALGGSGIVNRLTPLFGFYSSGAEDHFYTSWPQMSVAAIDGTMPPRATANTGPNPYSPRGGEIDGFTLPGQPCATQVTGAACSQVGFPNPLARVAIFTTHVNPYRTEPIDQRPPLLPLYRLSYACPNSASPRCTAQPLHVSQAYATSWPNAFFQARGYVLDGIEGYVVPPSESQPAGSVRLCRKLDVTRDDWALFPSTGTSCATPSEVLVDGGAYGSTGEGTDWLGYAFLTVDATDYDNDGMTNAAEITEGRNPSIKDNDVFSVNRLFARQQYRDFLGREGDEAGIVAWAGALASGITRAQVADGFFNSGEFQGQAAPIVRLYFAYFVRIPDYGGLDFWVKQARQGVPLELISQAFSGSGEFISRYGLNNTQFVTQLYQNVLNRAPDAGGLAYWVGQLDNGLMSRGKVTLGFSESAEFVTNMASEVYVTMMYVGMLRRAPDSGGFNYWVGYLDQGNSGLALINGFLTAPEYRLRFLPS